MSWMAAVRGQVLMCVCWFGVQVRVDVVSFVHVRVYTGDVINSLH